MTVVYELCGKPYKKMNAFCLSFRRVFFFVLSYANLFVLLNFTRTKKLYKPYQRTRDFDRMFDVYIYGP